MILTGEYQYPRQAAKVPARIRLTANDSQLVLLLEEQAEHAFVLSQVKVSEALGSIPFSLTFPDGGRFVPIDNATLAQWLAQHQGTSLIHRLERSIKMVLLTLFSTVLLVFLLMRVVLPWGSEMLVAIIPVNLQSQLGQTTLEGLEWQGFRQSELPVQRQEELQILFQQLLPAPIHQDQLPAKLVIRRYMLGANAFTLADGTIVITDELLKLAENDHQIAAVMLHELGHHNQRHVLQLVIRSSILAVASAWVIGDAGGVADSLLNSGAAALALSYSRDMECEADQFAIVQMQQQQRPLQAMWAIYSKLDLDNGTSNGGRLSLLSWFSTHPDIQERLQMIADAQQQQGIPP